MVTKITEKASLKVSYNGKAVNNGEMLTPSETQVRLPQGSRPDSYICFSHQRN